VTFILGLLGIQFGKKSVSFAEDTKDEKSEEVPTEVAPAEAV